MLEQSSQSKDGKGRQCIPNAGCRPTPMAQSDEGHATGNGARGLRNDLSSQPQRATQVGITPRDSPQPKESSDVELNYKTIKKLLRAASKKSQDCRDTATHQEVFFVQLSPVLVCIKLGMKSLLQVSYTPENKPKSKALGKVRCLAPARLEANHSQLGSCSSTGKNKVVATSILSRHERVSSNIVL